MATPAAPPPVTAGKISHPTVKTPVVVVGPPPSTKG